MNATAQQIAQLRQLQPFLGDPWFQSLEARKNQKPSFTTPTA